MTHPDVLDVAVVGVPDETWGERVGAVVASAAETLTEAELKDWIRRRLAGYKVPRTIVQVRQLPRTPTGKLELSWVRRVILDAGQTFSNTSR